MYKQPLLTSICDSFCSKNSIAYHLISTVNTLGNAHEQLHEHCPGRGQWPAGAYCPLHCSATVTVFSYYVQIEPECHNYIVSIVLQAIQTQKGSNLREKLHSLSAAKVFNVVGAKESSCKNGLRKMLFFFFFSYYGTTEGWLLCMYIMIGILCPTDVNNRKDK